MGNVEEITLAPNGPEQKRRRKGRVRDAEATRDDILDAALAEFAEKGLHGARVEEIAARTATSKHMIYYYFGSKDGLYSAVLARAYEDFRRAEGAVDYNALDPVEALRQLVGYTFDAHVRNAHVIRILMSENLDGGRHVKLIDHSSQRELVVSTTASILDRGAAAGLFRQGLDPVQFHQNVSALSYFSVANRFTFGTVFQMDMADEAVLAERREEVIEVMLSRCLLRHGG
jgi:AcrR family transcriptional regulator